MALLPKKYSIQPNVLFQWRKQFETIPLVAHEGAELSRIDRCRRDLTEIEKLQRLQDITMGRLTEEIRKGQVTSYNASIATSNIVSGFARLSALRSDVLDKLEQLKSTEDANAASDDIPIEIQREAESLVIELVRGELRRKEQARWHQEDGVDVSI